MPVLLTIPPKHFVPFGVDAFVNIHSLPTYGIPFLSSSQMLSMLINLMKTFMFHEMIASTHRMGWDQSSSYFAVEDNEKQGSHCLFTKATGAAEAGNKTQNPTSKSHLFPRCLWFYFTFTISETQKFHFYDSFQ